MSEQPQVTIRDNPERHRFEAVDESGVVAGFAAYRRSGDAVVLTHTEVDDAFEGHGVGSRLARGALDALREEGIRVVPSCPFISAYIQDHEEYADLVR
jgi:predicted GNAT family acetyltransferase